MIKLFGVLDVLAALAFFLNNNFDKLNHWFPNNLVLILGLYILIKGIIFLIILDFASAIDVICGIIILLSLSFSINPIITFLVTLFLIQKGILSLVQ